MEAGWICRGTERRLPQQRRRHAPARALVEGRTALVVAVAAAVDPVDLDLVPVPVRLTDHLASSVEPTLHCSARTCRQIGVRRRPVVGRDEAGRGVLPAAGRSQEYSRDLCCCSTGIGCSRWRRCMRRRVAAAVGVVWKRDQGFPELYPVSAYPVGWPKKRIVVSKRFGFARYCSAGARTKRTWPPPDPSLRRTSAV